MDARNRSPLLRMRRRRQQQLIEIKIEPLRKFIASVFYPSAKNKTGRFVQFFAGKFPSAPGADPRQDLERLIAIDISPPHPHLPRLGKNVLQFAAIRLGRRQSGALPEAWRLDCRDRGAVARHAQDRARSETRPP